MDKMAKKKNELEELEKLAESLTGMGALTQLVRNSYSQLESKIDDENTRLARVNGLLRESLNERNRLANYLNSILESIDSGAIVTGKNGRINIFNTAAEKFTGISAESALGKNYSDIMKNSASPEAELIIRGELSSASGEKTLNPRKGIDIPVAYSLSKLRRFGEDEMEGMVEIIYNLSETKKLEKELKHVSTLAALGEMAATVAHEIRNPLMGISGYTSLLARDLEDDKKNLDTVSKISKGVRALNAIVGNLLDFTKPINPNKMGINPISVIEETIAEFEVDSESKNHTFEIEYKTRNLHAELDPDLFRQIVYNLAKNAVQTNPNGGRVKLILKKPPHAHLTLNVEDDGPGIPDDIKENIFTPFFTTKTNGIGLGLATVKKLIELQGGSITAENKPGGGAVFTADFPGEKGDIL